MTTAYALFTGAVFALAGLTAVGTIAGTIAHQWPRIVEVFTQHFGEQ